MSYTFDPGNTSASITLSNGNLTAAGVAGVNDRLAIGTVFETAGLWYWETTINVGPGAGGSDGFMTIGAAYSGFPTEGLYLGTSVGYYPLDGAGIINGVGLGFVESATTGSVVCVALDLTHKKMWVRVNGGNWNNDVIGSQNPATNTGGWDVSGVSGISSTGVAAAVAELITEGNQVTANFGATTFAFTPPSGFAGFDGGGPPPPVVSAGAMGVLIVA